jgi:tripartite ATP-independent transporter DctP family solute receptor
MLRSNTFKTLAVALAVAGTTIMTGTAIPASAAKVQMKIANVVPGKAPRSLGGNKVAEMVNADKRCDVNAKTYHGGQLGGTTDLIEGLQIGSIEMVILPGSFLVGFQPLIGIMDFPFFWPPQRHNLAKIHKSNAMKKLLATTEEKGVVSVAIWHTGYKVWTGNKPLNKFANYAGLKARVMPSAVLKEQFRLFGVTAVGMPFPETYGALQNKAIDAQENPITTNFFMKFHEVQDYMALTNHGTLDQVIMLSKGWWDKRSGNCQTAIREAIDAGGKLTTDLTYSIIKSKALPVFQKAKIKVVDISKANFEDMKAKVLPGVEKFYVEQNGARGKAILDAFKVELAKLK